jgi:hypothetical protein
VNSTAVVGACPKHSIQAVVGVLSNDLCESARIYSRVLLFSDLYLSKNSPLPNLHY